VVSGPSRGVPIATLPVTQNTPATQHREPRRPSLFRAESGKHYDDAADGTPFVDRLTRAGTRPHKHQLCNLPRAFETPRKQDPLDP
jgi:hypothetical protein